MDLFIQVYVNALIAQVEFPPSEHGLKILLLVPPYLRRKSTDSWSNCLFLATMAQKNTQICSQMKDDVAGNDMDDTCAEFSAREGVKQLHESTMAAPSTETNWSYLED